MTNAIVKAKDKIISSVSSISGISGVFSSYNMCHSICIGAISLLSIIGITVAGMPLLFLQSIALPLWIFASVLFIITLALYFSHKKGVSKNLLMANFGMLAIGTPFVQETDYKIYFWIAGGIIVAAAIILVMKGRVKH